MKIAWRYLLLSFITLLLVVLAFTNQALFHAYLVEPLTRILWLAARTMSVVDQEVYWVLLALAVFLAGLDLLPARHELPFRSYPFHAAGAEDRVADWEALLQAAEDDPEARAALQRELKDLDGSFGVQLDRNEQLAEISLPPVKAGLRWQIKAAVRHSFLSRCMFAWKAAPDAEFQKSVVQALESIEKKMETHNDE